MYKTLDNKEVCVGVFLDLTEVFDMVNYDILLQKLDAYGIRGSAYQWFVSYLKKQETVGRIKSNPILGIHRVPFWDCCCF